MTRGRLSGARRGSRQRCTVVSNTLRSRSLSRKRPCRFFEKVKWSGNRTVEPEPAEPAVRKVQVNFLAQPSFRADAKAVADDQHADHQLRVDRGPTHLAVEWRQFLRQPVEFDEPVD